MPPVTTVWNRKQPCSGCRTRKKRCDATHPSCSNCRKWGIFCDYTNRTQSPRRGPAVALSNGHNESFPFTDSLNWDDLLPTSFSAIDNLPASGSVPISNPAWPASSGQGQIDVPPPDFFQGLDTDASVDAIPSISLVTPGSSTTNSTDLHPFDILGGVDNAGQVQASVADAAANGNQAVQSLQQNNAGNITDDVDDIFPPDTLLMELLNIYFDQHHVFLPFLHKARFMTCATNFSRNSPDREFAALIYGIIAIASATHDDRTVRSHQSLWFERAKRLCEDVKEKKYPSLQGIQASLCICALAWTTGNYPLSWLYIGTAWRQAVTLGLNRLDGEQNTLRQDDEPNCALDVEERRRTIWTLLMLDRGWAFPAGWPHAIDDRQFMVNFPVPDSVFQEANEETPSLKSTISFSRNLRKIIMTKPGDGGCSLYQAILKAYLLLGRATEHIHSLDAFSDPEEHVQEFQQLDTELSRFILSLPRALTELRSSSIDDAPLIIWLNAILSTITILLHHRPETSEVHLHNSPSTDGTPSSPSDRDTSFEYCVTAARKMTRLVQEATKISIAALINPNAAASFYCCGRILIMDYHKRKSEASKTGIEILLLLFERIGEVYPALGTKYTNAIQFNLRQPSETVHNMCKNGARGMLAKCGDWSQMNPRITFDNLVAIFGR